MGWEGRRMETALNINKWYVVLCFYSFIIITIFISIINEFLSRPWLMDEGKRVLGQEQDPLIRTEILLPAQPGILCVPGAKGTVGVRHQSAGDFTLGPDDIASPFLP